MGKPSGNKRRHLEQFAPAPPSQVPPLRVAGAARAMFAQTIREGERFTDSCAALAARLLVDGMHPESREVQQAAIVLGAQLGAWRFKAALAEARGES